MKHVLIIIFLIFLRLNAREIPPERLVDWSDAGAGDIPAFTNILTSSSLGLDNSGKTDNSAILNNAIDTAQKPVMFLFEPGTYLFNHSINLKANVAISGYSSEKTFFKFGLNNKALTCINVRGSAGKKFDTVTAGYFRGSDYLITANAGLFSPGDYIELCQDNGDWDTNPAGWAKNSVGQVLQIRSAHNDTLFFYEKLRINYSRDLHPRIRLLTPIKNCVLQYFNIERLDLPDNGAGYNILFSLAVNSCIKGIEGNKSVGSHCMINLSKNITVSGSYFHHAYIYDGSGTRGYGVTLNNHASDCLVENNIFRFLRHAMMVKHGANGNVFACNYSLEPNRSEPIANLSGDISLHGHFAYANLFESNIVQNIIIDDYWGPSGPLNTFFRNRAELYGIISTSDKSDSMNFAGNETTNTGVLMGRFLLKGSGHYLYGNNILGEIMPEGTGDFNQASIFYSDRPDFWDIPDPFPSIGLPNELGQYTIPAKYRYEHNNKKTVGEYIPVSVPGQIKHTVFLSPNPAADYVDITISGRTLKDAVRIYDVLGVCVLEHTGGGQVRLNVSGLAAGVYFVRVGGRVYKFVKL